MNTLDVLDEQRKNRYSRQAQLVPADRLVGVWAHVIGVGAVGRQVALQLTAMGVPKISLTDFDLVEDVNLAPQGYFETDISLAKVAATARLMASINSEVEVIPSTDRFRPREMNGENVVFCCVDTIESRKAISRAYSNIPLFLDGRMSGEVLRVLSFSSEDSYSKYQGSLFEEADAYQGACTTRSTIYSANILAGLEVSIFVKWLRGLELPQDYILNLQTFELSEVVADDSETT